jgi:hypothetical protein
MLRSRDGTNSVQAILPGAPKQFMPEVFGDAKTS